MFTQGEERVEEMEEPKKEGRERTGRLLTVTEKELDPYLLIRKEMYRPLIASSAAKEP